VQKRLYLFLEVSLGSIFKAELHCVSFVKHTKKIAKVAGNNCKILDNEKTAIQNGTKRDLHKVIQLESK